jgi:hypothetical protein
VSLLLPSITDAFKASLITKNSNATCPMKKAA